MALFTVMMSRAAAMAKRRVVAYDFQQMATRIPVIELESSNGSRERFEADQ
jgi:hypothetical protein